MQCLKQETDYVHHRVLAFIFKLEQSLFIHDYVNFICYIYLFVSWFLSPWLPTKSVFQTMVTYSLFSMLKIFEMQLIFHIKRAANFNLFVFVTRTITCGVPKYKTTWSRKYECTYQDFQQNIDQLNSQGLWLKPVHGFYFSRL